MGRSPSSCKGELVAAKKRGAIIGLSILLVVLVGVAVAGAAWLWRVETSEQKVVQTMNEEEPPAVPVVEEGEDEGDELPQNPIDFASLKAENSDVIAWLYIPGCDISLPVLQSPTDDLFYLSHDRNKEYDPLGTPFIQLANSRDLSDPVTVIYGHNKGLFGTLHYYEDEEFLQSNPVFYLYVPGHVYTYTIVSAYQYDSRHILNTFDFSNEEVLAEYFDFVQDPDSIMRNVNPNVKLKEGDKLVQLSTCTTDIYDSSARYIITAVQTGDQETR